MQPTAADQDALRMMNFMTQCKLRGKWIPVVIYLLRDGKPQRYTELKAQIKGISQKMLTQTLRQLEDEGMVTRTIYPTIPPMVEYTLTPEAVTLLVQFLDVIESHLQAGIVFNGEKSG